MCGFGRREIPGVVLVPCRTWVLASRLLSSIGWQHLVLCASYTNPPLELIFCSRNDPNTIGGGHANLAVLRNHLLDLGGSVMSEDKVIACRVVGKERERERK